MHLATTLSKLLEQRKLKAADATKATGIPHSQWSRWLNNDQTFISDDYFDKICATIFPDPREQAQLLLARLMDVREGRPGAKLIECRILGKEEKPSEPVDPYQSQLPARDAKVFAKLAQAIQTDKQLRRILHSLADRL